MRVLVQWARSAPGSWEAIDSSEWAALPRRDPRGANPADPGGDRGLVAAVCVQGVVITGDAIAVEDRPDGEVVVWLTNDDAATAGAHGPYSRRILFRPLAPDPRLGGAVNTRIEQTVYSDSAVVRERELEATTMRRRAVERRPDAALFRPGVLLADALWDAHRARQAPRSWREWADGLEQAFVDDRGRVRQMRRMSRYDVPKGTRTYFLSSTALANGLHVADQELQLALSPTTAALLSANTNGTETLFTGVTPANEPNSAAWPTGIYRCQLDVNTVNADLEFGLLSFGISAGHFARVSNFLVVPVEETRPQVEAAFTFSGLKLATTGSVSWTVGTAGDRFEVAIAGNRFQGHGQADITLEVNESDDFADGPWPAAGVSGGMLIGADL